MGVKSGYGTVHVGLGTVRPVKEDEIEDHPMHSEFCIIPEETARMVNETKANGGRVVCIGTTSCRTVESFADADGTLRAQSGWTDIFIYPGYKFKCMDALVTNFHLPESTLIMLVSALAGREHILNAYKIAVENRYRFFSFGDAMFIADGLDAGGAEKLLGRGDMLFSPIGSSKPTRVQGCFVTDGEVERIIEFIKQSSQKMTYDEQILAEIDRHAVSDNKKKGSKDDGGGFEDEDEMLPSAIEIVVETGQASTSMLQRKLKLGYARAARLMDAMEEKGIIGPFEGSKPRQVLITKERWIEMKMIAAARAEANRRNS